MAAGKAIVKENAFIGGLKTEFTGLNFPDNSCIDTYNMVFERTGKVERRLGFDYENSHSLISSTISTDAINQYLWKNVSGDGTKNLLVQQIANILHFYDSSAVSSTSSLSDNKLVSTINLLSYVAPDASGGIEGFDTTLECTFTDGNGYLFVLHPNIEPIYCEYDDGVVTATEIVIQVRDTTGIAEDGVSDNARPTTLTDIHRYNLVNQGWSGKSWSSSSDSSVVYSLSSGSPKAFTIDEDLSIKNGDIITMVATDTTDPMNPVTLTMTGSVIGYNPENGNLSVNVTSLDPDDAAYVDETYTSWILQPSGDFISEWYEDIGNYPSNADVWWYFKNENDIFDPRGQINSVSASAGAAPKGFFILDAFNQDRSTASGISGLDVVTSGGIRPSVGAWFQGRIWYAGANFKGFNENIYFSQIIENPSQFGRCYTVNDPTSQERFDLLPSDGGYIKIQGIGTIHKLFPTNNGMLVFGSRGIWFITGSSGIGFTANDFTVTNPSSIESLSHSSFVNVLGNPCWWNKEGIYMLQTAQGGINVQSMTNTTIASFYQDIPLSARYYAKGIYNPITFQIQWLYRHTAPTSLQRYEYTRVLNFDTQINAFYPWTVDKDPDNILVGIALIGGGSLPETIPPTVKYLTKVDTGFGAVTFSETIDSDYLDWGNDYDSYITTGWRVYTEAAKMAQIPYIFVYTEGEDSECNLQALWDYTTSGNQGKWSSKQYLQFNHADRAYQFRKVRLRGSGKAVQLKFTSISQKPMSLIGWSSVVEGTSVP